MLKRLFFVIVCLLMSVFCFTGCQDPSNHDGKIKIMYELEGGIYQNCTLPIVHYYPEKENGSLQIVDPSTLTGSSIDKAGYTLEGWYEVKSTNNGEAVYENKWDFENDFVTGKEITLYAKWVKNIKLAYDVCYYDENGNVKVLGSYPVKDGEKFEDYANYAKKRDGYTPLNYCDKDGNLWDSTFKHPGGDKDLTIQVFVNYIKGDFAIVKTAKELLNSVNENIYLLNNIDLEGQSINFNNYKGIFMGNGYTISNFKIYYDATRNGLIEDFADPNNKSLAISLFGNIENATIENVNFENVTVEIKTKLSTTYKIYVAPICTSSTNSTIKNVKFTGEFSVIEVPEGFNIEENMILVAEQIYYKKDDKSVIENNEINVLVK